MKKYAAKRYYKEAIVYCEYGDGKRDREYYVKDLELSLLERSENYIASYALLINWEPLQEFKFKLIPKKFIEEIIEVNQA